MSFYSDVIERDPRFNSPVTCRDMDLLEPITRAAVEAIISDASTKHGITLRVDETYRSLGLQAVDYSKGLSKLKKCGVHHYGLAADFFKVLSDGSAYWGGDWSFLATLARAHGMISGYDWGHRYNPGDWHDPDHVQRIAMADESKLFVGAWYPADDYQPVTSD